MLDKFGKAKGYSDTASQIRIDELVARERKGKSIWSETFLESRAPWRTPMDADWSVGADVFRVGQAVVTAGDHGNLDNWTFHDARGYLTSDGVIVATMTFLLGDNSSIQLPSLIRAIREMRTVAKDGFVRHATQLIHKERPVKKLFNAIGFTPGQVPKSEKIWSHRTVFASSLGCALEHVCHPHPFRDTKVVAGVLNLSEWFNDYHTEYLNHLGQKEFGYRQSELYITDKDSTLAVRQDFFDRDSSLHLYMGNILQAVEYQLGIQALLHGQLQYARALYSLNGDGSRGAASVEGVKFSRSILSGIYESLNYSVMVLHGFTRRLLSRLDHESEIRFILSDIERRIENVNDSVTLTSSVDQSDVSHSLQLLGNRIGRQSLLVTVLGVTTSVLALGFMIATWLLR